MAVLLTPALTAFEEGLQNYRNVQASDQYLDGKLPSIGDLLALADKELERLYDAWKYAMDALDLSTDNYIISPGSIVPTASPRELLVRLLVNHPVILQKIATSADTVLGEF